MKTKHIIHFPKWTNLTRIYESQENFTELNDRLKELNSKVESKMKDPNLSTRDILDWLNEMISIYNQGKFTGLVFNYIKIILTEYFKVIQKFFSSANKELTQTDLASIGAFRKLSTEETAYQKQADEKLKSLGLIK